MTIRRLGPEDAVCAQSNCALFWDMGSADRNFVDFLADPNCILLVGEIDGEPAGQIVGHILKRWDSKSPMLFLYSIDVAEQYRRRNLARGLIEEFHRIGRKTGCKSSFVFTNSSNAPAMHMYQALGGSRAHPDDVMFEWKLDQEPEESF